MSGKETVDFSESQLRKLFTRVGLRAEDVERAIADYMRYRESELSSLSLLSFEDLQDLGAEALTQEVMKLKDGKEIVEEVLRDYLRYINYKKDIAETYQESKDWHTVFSTHAYSDVQEAQEAFIDYLEEVTQTKVKDVKHLQKLTGITHITETHVKNKLVKAKDEDQEKQFAIVELEDTLTRARFSKFSRTMEIALQDGAKYKDLLKIKPKDYGLPETWNVGIAKSQYETILWEISGGYFINEGLMISPDLRSVAKDMEAPYSVVMDAYNRYSRY